MVVHDRRITYDRYVSQRERFWTVEEEALLYGYVMSWSGDMLKAMKGWEEVHEF